MARKPRLEVEGGLYHIIARGNDRQDIFHAAGDHLKFLTLLTKQKERFAFYLYAYCLMTNHIHLLIERQAESIGRIMQRLLTGYSQYYNRRYRHVGHVFQGRHKAILCQSERYLAELVRYIHLNPVRANMVALPEEYPHSSHRAYIGVDEPDIVDVNPVLRLFAPKRELARDEFRAYVAAGMTLGHRMEFYAAENDILGSGEFVDATIHRLGEVDEKKFVRTRKEVYAFDSVALIEAVESAFGVSQNAFCGPDKNGRAVMAKEVLILVARAAGATTSELSILTGLDTSNISRRHDAAKEKCAKDAKLAYARKLVERKYESKIAESQV